MFTLIWMSKFSTSLHQFPCSKQKHRLKAQCARPRPLTPSRRNLEPHTQIYTMSLCHGKWDSGPNHLRDAPACCGERMINKKETKGIERDKQEVINNTVRQTMGGRRERNRERRAIGEDVIKRHSWGDAMTERERDGKQRWLLLLCSRLPRPTASQNHRPINSQQNMKNTQTS